MVTPRLLRARAIPATEFSCGAAANVLLIFRDFSQKMSLARFGLACGSLLPFSLAGSLPPAKDVKNIRNEPNKSFSINKSAEKTNSNYGEIKRKNVLKIRKKAKTNRKTDLTGEE
jgi:hypothetical protein